jgi:hypothetical protein
MKQIITENQNDIYPLTVKEYETMVSYPRDIAAEVIDDDVFILIAMEQVEVE